MSEDTHPTSPEELAQAIEAQREQLAETVDELAHKLDVKAQARERTQRIRAAATDENGRPTPQALAAVGVVLAALAALARWRWNRRRGD